MQAVERFLANEALTTHIAKKFYNETTAHLWEDLLSAARLGLWKACLSFDESRRVQFSTYAGKCIENEIQLLLRREARQAQSASLEEPLFEEEDTGEPVRLASLLSAPDDIFSDVLAAVILKELKHFPTLAALVLAGKTQAELAAAAACSQAKISRRARRERKKLQKSLKRLGILSQEA